MSATDPDDLEASPRKRDETLAFVFLSIVLFPILAIAIVGGFGFIVWMQHLMFGPPGS
jgi:nitrate reductase NapE